MLKHSAVGFAISFFVVVVLMWRAHNEQRRQRLLLALPVVLLCAFVWSILPWILLRLPVIKILMRTPLNNVFFFYGIVKRLSTTGATWGLGMIYLIFFFMTLMYARALGTHEKRQIYKNN